MVRRRRRGDAVVIGRYLFARRRRVTTVVRHGLDRAVVFHRIRRQFDGTRGGIHGDALVLRHTCRQPLARRAFAHGDGLRFVVFVGVGDVDFVGVRPRGDGHAALFCPRAFFQDGFRRVSGCAFVGQGDGRRLAFVARFVAYGVFDRCRATSKASSRAEGHGAVVGNVPGAFAAHFQGLHFVAAAVQELYGRRVNVALGIPVVRQDVDRRGCPYFEAVQVVVVGVRRLALRGVDGFVHVAARVHAFFAVTDGHGYGRQVFARVDVRSARGGQAYGARRRVDAVVAVRVAVRGQAVGQAVAILVSATAGRDLLAFCCLSLFWVQGHADFQGRCVVRRRRRRGGTVGNFCRWSAGDVFLMSRVIGVTHFDGNGLAFVARLDGVGLSGADFLTVG